jgi:DNA repair exonuclease SbcCD nuclease subunit
MIKILHTADWHMDAPLREFDEIQRRELRQASLALPGKIADLCIREGCDLCLLCGDIFDGVWSPEGYEAVYRALERMEIPVFIAPGNHDPYRERSIWAMEQWPENVYLFRSPELGSYRVAELDCRVYGAAFTSTQAEPMLDDFFAECEERYAILAVHGDPTNPASVYNPITAAQLRETGIDYAALGHIHARGQFEAGAGLCAWPGCPMGHGFDETGVKGVLIAELGDTVSTRFVPLEVPRFLEYTVEAGVDPAGALESVLPPIGSRDHFRIRITGEAEPDEIRRLAGRMGSYPNLTLIDETVPVCDLWENAGEDSLSGLFFGILRSAAADADPKTAKKLELAARISRRILQRREVELP